MRLFVRDRDASILPGAGAKSVNGKILRSNRVLDVEAVLEASAVLILRWVLKDLREASGVDTCIYLKRDA